MTTRDLADVGIKLLGLSVAVGAITGLSTLSSWIFMRGEIGDADRLAALSVQGSAVGTAVALGMGVSLMAYSGRLGGRLFPREVEIPMFSGVAAGTVLFAVVGIYMAADALPTLLRLALHFRFLGAWEYEHNRGQFWHENAFGVAAETLRLLLGVGLFAGSGALMRLLQRLRTAGAPPPADSDTPGG